MNLYVNVIDITMDDDILIVYWIEENNAGMLSKLNFFFRFSKILMCGDGFF